MNYSYFVPKLRHFLCPGMNLLFAVTVLKRNDPLDAFAGDKFNDAIATGSATTDSLELQLDELGTDEGGSNFNDNLTRKFHIKSIQIKFFIAYYVLVLIVFNEFLQLFNITYGI